MLRTLVVKLVCSGKNPIFDGSQSFEMSYPDQMTEIAYNVRTYFWATIQYKYHGIFRNLNLDVQTGPEIRIRPKPRDPDP